MRVLSGAAILCLCLAGAGCRPATVSSAQEECGCGYDDDYGDYQPPNEDSLSLWVERQDAWAMVNVEFIPAWGEPDDFGWFIQHLDTTGEVQLEVSLQEVDEELVNESFDAGDVECVRFNVSFGEDCEWNPNQDHCSWLCEGNGDSAHFTADFSFQWPEGDWGANVWSHPDGVDYGCSALACR